MRMSGMVASTPSRRLCMRDSRSSHLAPRTRVHAVQVHNALSLSSILRKSASAVRPANAAAVETPAAPSSSSIHPRKAVQAVLPAEKPAVEQMMALTNLAANPSGPLATKLSEHELQLVTTSATCDDMFGSALDSYSEDMFDAGDGMAMPIADIRAAAEQLAAEVKDSNNMSSEWNPSKSPGSSSFSSTSTNYASTPAGHALEQLMAQSDYDAMAGSGAFKGSSSSRDVGSMMSRVHSLQSQIKQAAAKATAVGRQQQGTKSGSAGSASAVKKQSAAAHGNASDDDCYGDAAAMPVLPRPQTLPGSGSSAVAAAMCARAAAAAAAAKPSYPVYTDPASTWIVADSADGLTRHIVIQAPESLAAAVAGTRASSDLVTFETYDMGAKINKRLYTEANALYNRFMPLLLDHLEEKGPAARVMMSGAGLGGSLAALLLLMFVARGMRPSALGPVYTLNAPAVLCEVPDFKQWCSKDGCSLEEIDGMMEDLLHRGILSQLGLAQDAIRNIYHQQAAAEAAVQAVQPLGPLQAVAASSSKQLSSIAHHFDVAALRQSPMVPDVLKAWLRNESTGAASGYQHLHILNPVGKMMLYVAAGRS